MLVAENLIKCHPHYRGLSALWAQQKVEPRDRRCRIANRECGWFISWSAGGRCGAAKASTANACWPNCRSSIAFTTRRLTNRFAI